jgi:hypothetical protein
MEELKFLNNEKELEYSFRPELIRENCSCGSGWCGVGLVNIKLDINLATSVTVGRG